MADDDKTTAAARAAGVLTSGMGDDAQAAGKSLASWALRPEAEGQASEVFSTCAAAVVTMQMAAYVDGYAAGLAAARGQR